MFVVYLQILQARVTVCERNRNYWHQIENSFWQSRLYVC